MTRCLVALIGALLATGVTAQSHDHATTGSNAPYAGLEHREIKSLSEGDLAELRAGKGWGLALPAELNGRPGPAHLLELKDEIGLSAEQVRDIQSLYDRMKADAIAAGARFIAAERALSVAFEAETLSEPTLRQLVEDSERVRAELRLVHLKQHLATPALLSNEQIAAYNRLRGYASDPCATVPEGHDPVMWRKHNGCG